MSTIVVGIDGSDGSVGALNFALEEARIRGASVKAVSAWHVPPAVYGNGYVAVSIDPNDFKTGAKIALDKALAGAKVAASGVSVTPVLREGQAADVLVEEAHDADLLVVGSRGLGGFKGLLLGSVSQQCTTHADCPVTIVPNGKSRG